MAKIGDSSGDCGEQARKGISKLKTTLKNLKVVISLGRIDEYLIVSVANDNQHLANWGKGKLLGDSPEFAPLRNAGDKKFTDIGYASKAMAVDRRQSRGDRRPEGPNSPDPRATRPSAVFPGELPITEDSIKKITELYLEDMEKLQKLISEASQSSRIVELHLRCRRRLRDDELPFGEEKSLDGEEELSILSHVGKEPILFAAGRGKQARMPARCCAMSPPHFGVRRRAVEFGDDEEGKKIQEILDKSAEKGKPIVKQFVEDHDGEDYSRPGRWPNRFHLGCEPHHRPA